MPLLVATTNCLADSPRMKLTLGSNLRESDIQEGRDVYLDCKIRANPVTSEVIWEFEGQELQTDKNKGKSNSLALSHSEKGAVLRLVTA